eukprot:TRINITY_DN4999_c0_g1_i1.p1 TRINITY_DN4999_c0_g1~~TRINITY_DN4999_c0_g1_i1.p1  ORF type:complete len:283 (-),score=25.91 TRINITY_DN4999_c0_g1_i1:473-1321(-)
MVVAAGHACEFAPKKAVGPLSRRCAHCGRHEDEHGTAVKPIDTMNVEPSMRVVHPVLSAEPRRIIKDTQTGLEVEVWDDNSECYLLRDLLGPEEQAELYQFIQDRDKTRWGELPRAMDPKPTTLVLGENQQPLMGFTPGDTSVVTEMVARASDLVNRSGLQMQFHPGASVDLDKYKSVSMAAIQYEAPTGKFPPHVDHCGESCVYLMTLGCSANFMVKGPSMAGQANLKLRSGDLLVFNASTEAALLHGVTGIDDGSCPQHLGDAFNILRNHRYGVQCRLYF